MRVALIAPPFPGSARGLPLGLAHIAAVLEERGFEVSVLDMTVGGAGPAALISFLERVAPDVVGVSAVCATYLEAVSVAKICRATLGSSVKILLGGPHVTFATDTVLARHDCFDICVVGEAEQTVAELCEALASKESQRWRTVPGIAFRDGPLIRKTPARTFISELDDLPFPARSHFPEAAYLDAVGVFEVGATNKAELIASRGCPYPCEFCSTKEFWQRKYRNRSPEHVVRELEQLAARGTTDLYFNDDIFTIQRTWVEALCALLADRRLNLRWACGTRADRVDRQLLAKMKAAGCVYVYFGVETGSDSINQHQKKGASVAQVEAAYEMLRESGIFASAALIFGLPGETSETARNTVDWVRDVLRPDEVWISKATCYPGTPLAREFGITPEDYEQRANGRCVKGLQYGTGGIYTPFFDDLERITGLWDYIETRLDYMSVGFGDDGGHPFVEADRLSAAFDNPPTV